jgi:cephalosporin-C deacetylase
VLTDFDEHELAAYRSAQQTPADFDEFWRRTLATSREAWWSPRLKRMPSPVRAVELYDVEFAGFAGNPIRAWLRVPGDASDAVPAVVQYVGYGGGRGLAEEGLHWAASGFAHLQMDTRGQGAMWSAGGTSDDGATGPSTPGFLTRGIGDPEQYYYRRLIADAVLAVDAVRSLARVDAARVSVFGTSQGGGLALAVAALAEGLRSAHAFVPFLCDFPRAIRITDREPYREIGRYLAVHRGSESEVLRTLSYFDGVNFARRATTPVTMSAALMDATCPPSTVFGAFHAYAGPKRIRLWPWNAHEGGGLEDELAALRELTD